MVKCQVLCLTVKPQLIAEIIASQTDVRSLHNFQTNVDLQQKVFLTLIVDQTKHVKVTNALILVLDYVE